MKMPLNPSGSTPMMLNGMPSRSSVEPTKSGSPPLWRCQKPLLTTATAAAVRTSSSVNERPRTGSTPSTSK